MSELADMKALLGIVAKGDRLSEEQAEAAFNIIMSGDATPAQIGGFLMALRVRGETVAEITGAARAMRAKCSYVAAPKGAMDIVGTGGDGTGTFNISTGAAIVTAACGVPIAKHGNRALSSKSGAADTLTALGINLDADFAVIEHSIREAKIGFLMAPRHHSAMRHVGPARVELATRTVFNLLGPICNPAGVTRQMTGVFAKEWVRPVAETLGRLGTEAAWVVHGSDGSDEITTTGATYVAEIKNGNVREFEITPEDAGLKRVTTADLKGGDAETNAAAVRAMLGGEPGPYRDVVLMNAAAALIVAEKAKDLKDGVRIAAEAIASGAARKTLETMVAISQSRASA
jgi:anthranilate phosphoribosyltransferase